MKTATIVQLSLLAMAVLQACASKPPARLRAPDPGAQAYAERELCVPTDVPRIGPQFSCGNDRHMVTVFVFSPGSAKAIHAYGDALALNRDILSYETPCLAIDPRPDEQCGFPASAPVGSSVLLRAEPSGYTVKMTLIDRGYVLYDVHGKTMDKDFTKILGTPLSEEDRHCLVHKGLPDALVSGLL